MHDFDPLIIVFWHTGIDFSRIFHTHSTRIRPPLYTVLYKLHRHFEMERSKAIDRILCFSVHKHIYIYYIYVYRNIRSLIFCVLFVCVCVHSTAVPQPPLSVKGCAVVCWLNVYECFMWCVVWCGVFDFYVEDVLTNWWLDSRLPSLIRMYIASNGYNFEFASIKCFAIHSSDRPTKVKGDCLSLRSWRNAEVCVDIAANKQADDVQPSLEGISTKLLPNTPWRTHKHWLWMCPYFAPRQEHHSNRNRR